MKYPKPGSPNPIVTFHVYDLDTPLSSQFGAIAFEGDFPDDERIITEVMWAGDDNVLVKVMNRVQDIARVILVDVNIRKGRTIREENADELDGGWYEIVSLFFQCCLIVLIHSYLFGVLIQYLSIFTFMII
jgi:dipeptidyl aminopeptidase